MDDTTTNQPPTWGGLTAVELGVLIGGVALAILLVIICANVIVYKCRSKKKNPKKDHSDDKKLVNIQTARTVDGQHMQQVILKTQPNGNMEKQNSNSIPYQTMDVETNHMRYDTGTANQPQRQEPQVATISAQIQEPKTEAQVDVDADSGTGDSPVRAAVDVHSEQGDRSSNSDAGERVSRLSQHSSNVSAPSPVVPNAAYHSDEEETPYAYSIPPPPVSMPPPLTPGIPVTDLDEGETFIVPPPPPRPKDDIYAQINKDRGQSIVVGASASREESMKRSTYRPSAEIQIIEREKF